MKMARRFLALLLVFITVVSVAGCKSSEEGKTEVTTEITTETNKEEPAATTKPVEVATETKSEFQTTYGSKTFDDVTITVEVFDRSNAPEGSTVLDNKWVDYVNENMNKVGITVEFVAVPRSEEVAKIQLLMASGTAPDLMLSYSNPLVEGFYQDGGTYDLAPYVDAEDQAINLKEYIGADSLNAARNDANELWAITARRSVTTQSNLFIRKDWLDALGLGIPTTVEEMYTALDAFKNNNPEGRTDVIASSFNTAWAGVMAYSFLDSVTDQTTFNINSGNATDFIYTDAGFNEYMKWMNKLYNEGLMDTEYYVNNDFGQTMKEYFVNGQLGCFEADVNYNVDNLRGGLLQNLKASNPNAEFVSMSPLKNVNDGQVYNNGTPKTGAYVFVPKTAKNVEAAVTYLDWLATKEGGFALFHGFEGEHFNFVDGVPVIIDANYNATDKDWTRHDLFLIGNQGYYATPEDFAKATSKEIPGYEEYILNNYKNAGLGTARNATTFTAPTYIENSTEILLIADEYFVKLVTCKPDEYDANFAEFIEKLKATNYDTIIQERTDYFK